MIWFSIAVDSQKDTRQTNCSTSTIKVVGNYSDHIRFA